MLMKDKNIIIGGKNSEDLLGYFDETCKLVDEEDQWLLVYRIINN